MNPISGVNKVPNNVRPIPPAADGTRAAEELLNVVTRLLGVNDLSAVAEELVFAGRVLLRAEEVKLIVDEEVCRRIGGVPESRNAWVIGTDVDVDPESCDGNDDTGTLAIPRKPTKRGPSMQAYPLPCGVGRVWLAIASQREDPAALEMLLDTATKVVGHALDAAESFRLTCGVESRLRGEADRAVGDLALLRHLVERVDSGAKLRDLAAETAVSLEATVLFVVVDGASTRQQYGRRAPTLQGTITAGEVLMHEPPLDLEPELASLVVELSTREEWVTIEEFEGSHVAFCRLASHTEHAGRVFNQIGTMVIRRDDPFSPADTSHLEQLALAARLVLRVRSEVADAEERARGMLLDDVLAHSSGDPESLVRRAAGLDVDLNERQVIAVAGGPDDLSPIYRDFVAIARSHRGLATRTKQSAILLLPLPSTERLVSLLRSKTSRDVLRDLMIGVAGPAVGVDSIAVSAREARRCSTLLIGLDAAGSISNAVDLVPFQILFGDSPPSDLASFISRTLAPVLSYDAAHGTQLTATLHAWFETRGNISASAERLHVHANTVYQRLERISSLLGTDWQDPGRALFIQMAVVLHRLSSKFNPNITSIPQEKPW